MMNCDFERKEERGERREDGVLAGFVQKVQKTSLCGQLTCAYKVREQMKDYTSFKIGGPVSLMFFPKSQTELIEVCDLLKENNLKPLVLGRGSNLLVDDKPLDIVVLNTLGLDNIRLASTDSKMKAKTAVEVVADAGVGLNTLATFACEHELTGLEFAHGIPGTLGGGIMMNAGAYNSEMKDVVDHTTAFSFETGIYTVQGAQHDFGYRHSRFMDTCDIITSAGLKLKKADPELIKAKMEQFSLRRRESQPLDMASAGSVFKRPKQGYAAALIDQAGLKGYSVGDAQVSEKHAGFIVNRSKATFSDVISVIEHVQEKVMQKFGVELELEVRIINAECRMQNAELL